MKTKLLLFVLSMFLTLNVFAQPKKVMWVTETGTADQYDADWITMFINQGFDASQKSHGLFSDPATPELKQEQLDIINSAAGPDIVLIARPTDSGKFSTSTQAYWNAITKPVILMNPYCVRQQRLNWLPTDDGIIQGGVFIPDGPKIDDAIFPNDYIFNNIDLNTVALENNPASTETFYVGASSYTNISLVELDLDTNGVAIFTNNESGPALIRFKKDVPTFTNNSTFPDGATPAGDRTYFPMGSGSGGPNYGPPSALGIKLLVNEMNLMMNPTLSTSDFLKKSNFSVWTDREQSTVNVRNKTDELKTIEIFNMTGQTVKTLKNISGNEISVDVAGLTTGLYIIKINNNYNQKFVVK